MPIGKIAPATNSILGALSRKDAQRLFTRHEQVDLVYGDILCEPGKPLLHVYFPDSGIISLLTPVDRAASVEVGLVGREGMAGMALFLGVNMSPVRMLVQGNGSAMRITAREFRIEIGRNEVLRQALNLYLYRFMVQVAQTAACNRAHQTGQRLARWLLMTHDRSAGNEFHMTHEFLARMLGVRREGVTTEAGILQSKKLLRYSRGNITILNRRGLERASCGCYATVNEVCRRAAK
jgi:CRP-like cAMP-binding protein